MKIGDYIVLGVILLWLVLAFCWMLTDRRREATALDAVAVQGKTAKNVKKMAAMECKPCLVRMKNILYNSL